MADDVTLNTMTGGDVIGADEIAGVKYQRVKLIEGANGTNDGDISAANPLPIEGTVTANLSATDNTVLDDIDSAIDAINAKLVTGTVIGDVNLGATDNAVMDTIHDHLHAIDGKLVTGTVIGDVNLGATDNAVLDTIDSVLDAINAKLVTGTVIGDVNLGATDNAVLDAIALAVKDEAGAVTSGILIQGDDGTDRTNVLVDTAGHLQVDIVSSAGEAVTITSGTVTTVTTLTGGGVAHDAGDSGNPVKIGTKCESTPSAQVVADTDRSDVLSDMDGAVFVRTGVLIGDILNHSFSDATGNNTADTVFTTGAGIRNVITDVVAYNSSATGGYCNLTDGNGGTVLLYVPLPAGGGSVINLQTPIKTTANTALYWDISGALSTVYMTITGYRTKVT